jgi:hypothetical protein
MVRAGNAMGWERFGVDLKVSFESKLSIKAVVLFRSASKGTWIFKQLIALGRGLISVFHNQ